MLIDQVLISNDILLELTERVVELLDAVEVIGLAIIVLATPFLIAHFVLVIL